MNIVEKDHQKDSTKLRISKEQGTDTSWIFAELLKSRKDPYDVLGQISAISILDDSEFPKDALLLLKDIADAVTKMSDGNFLVVTPNHIPEPTFVKLRKIHKRYRDGLNVLDRLKRLGVSSHSFNAVFVKYVLRYFGRFIKESQELFLVFNIHNPNSKSRTHNSQGSEHHNTGYGLGDGNNQTEFNPINTRHGFFNPEGGNNLSPLQKGFLAMITVMIAPSGMMRASSQQQQEASQYEQLCTVDATTLYVWNAYLNAGKGGYDLVPLEKGVPVRTKIDDNSNYWALVSTDEEPAQWVQEKDLGLCENDLQEETDNNPEEFLKIYTIQSGDTLGKIAEMYGISVQDIVKDNGITDPNMIKINQKLEIRFTGIEVFRSNGLIFIVPSDSGFDDLQVEEIIRLVREVGNVYNEVFGSPDSINVVPILSHEKSSYVNPGGVMYYGTYSAFTHDGFIFFNPKDLSIHGVGSELAHHWGYPDVKGFSSKISSWGFLEGATRDESLMAPLADYILGGGEYTNSIFIKLYETDPKFFLKVKYYYEEFIHDKGRLPNYEECVDILYKSNPKWRDLVPYWN